MRKTCRLLFDSSKMFDVGSLNCHDFVIEYRFEGEELDGQNVASFCKVLLDVQRLQLSKWVLPLACL